MMKKESCSQASSRRARPSTGRLILAVLATSSLAACSVGPDFRAPAAPLTSAYIADQQAALAEPGSGEARQMLEMGAFLQTDWWTLFGSTDLDATVELALANNKDIAAARANVAKAIYGIAAAKGALLPQVDASAAALRQKVGATTLGPNAFTFPTFSSYSGGAEISYDLDVFGANSRRVEQASAEAEAERQKLNALQLLVAGGSVIESLQIAATRAQIEVMEDIIASDEKTLALVKTALDTGVATRIDLASAQSQLDRDRALLPPLRQQLNVAESALAVLAGRAPADWEVPRFELHKLSLPENLPLVVPADLVRTRPDIRAAEANLHAASATIGVATADLYPHVKLSASFGGQGLVSGGFESAWSLIGGVVGPIFDGGSRRARKRQAVEAYEASFAQYQQTVLLAFQQVADALHGLSNTAEAMQAQKQALSSAAEALALTRQGFASGSTGVVQVLDAQRLVRLAEIELIQARTQRYIQTAALFMAMGGGGFNDVAGTTVLSADDKVIL